MFRTIRFGFVAARRACTKVDGTCGADHGSRRLYDFRKISYLVTVVTEAFGDCLLMATNEPIAGRLTREGFGWSMPVHAPAYQKPPFFYRDAQAMIIPYETDPYAAADLLPEGVQLPLPAVAMFLALHYPNSTFGPYYEAIQGVVCLWRGAAHLYVPHIVVDSVPPLIGGREVWGYPKKMARIGFSRAEELIQGSVERPDGFRLVSAAMRPEGPPKPALPLSGNLTVRLIPDANGSDTPALAELIRVTTTDVRVHETWAGPATLSYDLCSTFDPWYKLPVVQLSGPALYQRWDFTLPAGQVVHTY